MKCSNCGHENASDASYCTNCKNNLSTTAGQTQAAAPAYSASSSQAPSATTSANSSTPSQTPSAAPAYSSTPSQTPSATPAYNSTPSYNPAPTRPVPYTYQQPYYYQHPSARPKQVFTITDAYIIIGFVLSVIGVFTYAFILLPAGIGFSIIGFVRRTNARTLGLSVAGIVVGVVACFIRVGMLLNELGIIPDWLSSGIF
ncbi:MAG: hypothetical protein FWE83_03125 [Oscillospiraceae bacterium]|nr:hypothetical protein [Oscillospiraceae bacterium]